MDDRPGGPRLVVTCTPTSLRAGHPARLLVQARVLAPPSPDGRSARAPHEPWASALALLLRPSAGVTVAALDGLPPADSPLGELGWSLGPLVHGGETRVQLRLDVDRGLAQPGAPVPLAWLRIAGASAARRLIAGPAQLLALPASAHEADDGPRIDRPR